MLFTDALCISMDHFLCTWKSHLNRYDAIRRAESDYFCVRCINAFYLEYTMYIIGHALACV